MGEKHNEVFVRRHFEMFGMKAKQGVSQINQVMDKIKMATWSICHKFERAKDTREIIFCALKNCFAQRRWS